MLFDEGRYDNRRSPVIIFDGVEYNISTDPFTEIPLLCKELHEYMYDRMDAAGLIKGETKEEMYLRIYGKKFH